MQTAENWYGDVLLADRAAYPSIEHPHERPALRLVPSGEVSGAKAVAYVNDGRWMVNCPFCTSAQLAWETDHRFYCAGAASCNNGGSGKFVKVVWPAQKKRERIEWFLQKRPVKHQHWYPHEDAEQLKRENEERGIF